MAYNKFARSFLATSAKGAYTGVDLECAVNTTRSRQFGVNVPVRCQYYKEPTVWCQRPVRCQYYKEPTVWCQRPVRCQYHKEPTVLVSTSGALSILQGADSLVSTSGALSILQGADSILSTSGAASQNYKEPTIRCRLPVCCQYYKEPTIIFKTRQLAKYIYIAGIPLLLLSLSLSLYIYIYLVFLRFAAIGTFSIDEVLARLGEVDVLGALRLLLVVHLLHLGDGAFRSHPLQQRAVPPQPQELVHTTQRRHRVLPGTYNTSPGRD